MGVVQEKSELYKVGFRSGDVLYKVNGNPIYNPSDIALEGKNILKTVSVRRNGDISQLQVSMQGETFFQAVAKHPPLLRKPVVVNKEGQKFIVSLSSEKISWKTSFAEMDIVEKQGFLTLFPVIGDLASKKEPKLNREKTKAIERTIGESTLVTLSKNGYRSLDLLVKSVNANSPAEKAGVRSKDIILSLNNKEVFSFEELRRSLQKIESESVSVKILSEGRVKEVKLVPDNKEISGQKVKLIGVYSGGMYQDLNFVDTGSKGLIKSTTLSFQRTWDTIVKTVEGFMKLITGKVSIKTIGGPLAIGKVASDSFHMSLSYFFQLMALISVNLGVINLFPIPVLDGGHILFIFFELINRGPVSRRKMEIAQQVGLSFLLMLMVGAIVNDFSRFF